MENPLEFEKISPADWKSILERELKDTSIEALKWQVAQEIKAEPAYLENKQPLITSIPKNRPLEGWLVTQKIPIETLAQANSQALSELLNGTNELVFEGKMTHSEDLKTLLKDIKLPYISVFFNPAGITAALPELIAEYLKNQKLESSAINGGIWFDPIATLMTRGNWVQNEYRDFETCGAMISTCIQQNLSHFKPVSINATVYSLAGADAVEELACALAHTNEYLHWFKENNIDLKKGVKHLNYRFAVGRGYFTQICKLRAFRPLLANLFQAYGIHKNQASSIHLACETSLREQTLADPYNNLLRATTQAMSAVIGGCTSLLVQPFDLPSGKSSEFSERIAKNIQLILNEEAFIGAASDAAAGAYLFEHLTRELMEKSWKRFQEIEASGGLIQNLKDGAIQKRIAAQASNGNMQIDEGKMVYVGVNRYHSKETPLSPSANLHDPITESKQIETLHLERATQLFENKLHKS